MDQEDTGPACLPTADGLNDYSPHSLDGVLVAYVEFSKRVEDDHTWVKASDLEVEGSPTTRRIKLEVPGAVGYVQVRRDGHTAELFVEARLDFVFRQLLLD
jgi:hypothetical protein